jgi:hypothetical protein
LDNAISQLTTYLEESPTAAEILDLDNLSGLRSETVKGDPLAWKKLPLILLRTCLENPFLMDFVKYETMRAEIDFVVKEG